METEFDVLDGLKTQIDGNDPEFDGGDPQEMFEHFRYVVDPGQEPLRVDKFLAGQMESTSRSRIQLAIKAGFVRCGEKVLKANYVVRPGDIISFVMPYRRRGTEILPEDIALDIVYEDSELLVVNKPAGMVVHPGHGHYSGTLVNALAYHLGMRQAADEGDERMGMLVHRIDKDTSGLLVVSKTDEAQACLAKQFFVHSIERRYIAVVWGNLPEDEGTIDGNIGRDPTDRLKFRVFHDGEQGKTAITHYKVLARYGFVTVVECRLETGRTHQIRVHMSYIGHPLFGDERYGGTTINKGTIYAKYRQFIQNCFEICPRQALHAAVLGFEHPAAAGAFERSAAAGASCEAGVSSGTGAQCVTTVSSDGRHLHFEAPLPDDMQALIAKWRDYSKNLGVEL